METLPDEIVLKILRYVDPNDLGRCRQVSHQLNRLCRDPILLKEFPHSDVNVNGQIYLNEQAYTDPKLLGIILVNKDVDLDWLVSRQTKNMKHLSETAWCLSFSIWDAARDLASADPNRVPKDDWANVGCNAWRAIADVTLNGNLFPVWKQARSLATSIVLSKYDDMIARIGRSYQIYQCLLLLCLDHNYYRKLDKLARNVFLIHKIKLTLPLGNPWTKQYQELFMNRTVFPVLAPSAL